MSLTRSRAVLDLGQKLVAQLDAADDLLSSWMSHYVAELIEATDHDPSDERARAACADAILQLWRHRAVLRDQARPLPDLELVARVLASLDTGVVGYRYDPEMLAEAKNVNADESTTRWLKVAISMDAVARRLVRFALRSAVDRAATVEEPWVELVREAGLDDDIEFQIGSLLRFDDQTEEASAVPEHAQGSARRDSALTNFEAFLELADSLLDDFQR